MIPNIEEGFTFTIPSSDVTSDDDKATPLSAQPQQPSLSTFTFFNTLMLLSGGLCTYFGPIHNAVAFFHNSRLEVRYNRVSNLVLHSEDLTSLNFRAQERAPNPADFVVAVASGFPSEVLAAHYLGSEEYRTLYEQLCTSLAADQVSMDANALTH